MVTTAKWFLPHTTGNLTLSREQGFLSTEWAWSEEQNSHKHWTFIYVIGPIWSLAASYSIWGAMVGIKQFEIKLLSGKLMNFELISVFHNAVTFLTSMIYRTFIGSTHERSCLFWLLDMVSNVPRGKCWGPVEWPSRRCSLAVWGRSLIHL